MKDFNYFEKQKKNWWKKAYLNKRILLGVQ